MPISDSWDMMSSICSDEFWSDGRTLFSSSQVTNPRAFADLMNFFTVASFMSSSGPSVASGADLRFAVASDFAIPSLRRPLLSVRLSRAVSTLAGWAFTVPVALGGGALTGWVLAASGFGVATGLAAALVPALPLITGFTGSTFFESLPVAAFAA